MSTATKECVKAVTLYDVGLDETRPVTQADVDKLLMVGRAQSKFRTGIRLLEDIVHAVITEKLPFDELARVVSHAEKATRLIEK